MKWLKKILRMKEQVKKKNNNKKLQDQVNKEEIGNLSEKEFRVMIEKKFQDIKNRMEKIQETFNKDLEEIKNKQMVINEKITEIKNTLEGTDSRITEAEEWKSDLEDCGCCSVAQSRLTLRDSTGCSMPGFLVLHHLPEFAQTHVHWVGDAIQPSHPRSSPSPPAFNLSMSHAM